MFDGAVSENEILLSVLLIAIIGIPHGAIDHILFLKKTNKSKVFFYSFYLLLILLSIFAWFYIPVFSLSVFLIISAYHFGQSQIQHYTKLPKLSSRLISLFWGISIISGFVIINYDQVYELMSNQVDFNVFTSIFDFTIYVFLFIVSSLVLIITSIYNRTKFNIRKETLYFLLIIGTFTMQSVFIGFSLFFVFNHSLVVLQSEHSFLSRIKKNFNLTLFIKDLIPFTLLSLLGVGLLYFMSEIKLIDLSLPLIVLISIASLTLPHAVVMEVFYQNRK